MTSFKSVFLYAAFLFVFVSLQAAPSEAQLAAWLKRFPDADANKDGVLSLKEAKAYLKKVQAARKGQSGKPGSSQRGAQSSFRVDSGWKKAPEFPPHAACYKTPAELKKMAGVTRFPKQENGILRLVGTGHSFMAPGYRALPKICEAAGFNQPLKLTVSGGVTGSTRYRWELENGIFQFDGNPRPTLLASIANAQWDVMTWGPYFNDQPRYYACWIDYCLKYNPGMKFYLSDAWPQLHQLDENPKSEADLTEKVIKKMGAEKRTQFKELVNTLRKDYPDKVFILPTSDAMCLAALSHIRGELPGVEGLHKAVGGKERSLWRDRLGHLGPGFDRLEGYVFYATLYARSPELLPRDPAFGGDPEFPSPTLDKVFRNIAWQAVINHPLSGVTDKDVDGVGDRYDN